MVKETLLPLRLQRRLTPAATYAAQFTEPQQHAGQSFGLDGHSPQRLKEAAAAQHMQQQRPRISGVGELPQTEAQVVMQQRLPHPSTTPSHAC